MIKQIIVAGIMLGMMSIQSMAGTKVNIDLEIAGPKAPKRAQIVLELEDEKAPKTVANFLSYVKSGYYKGTIFHRVINGFMIQGGGLDESLSAKKGNAPIKNEASNGLPNVTGSVAMARTSVIDSATSQFFINVADNSFLNHKDKSPRGYGYAVFAKVIEGMDVVNQIKAIPTHSKKGYRDVPVHTVKILNTWVQDDASDKGQEKVTQQSEQGR